VQILIHAGGGMEILLTMRELAAALKLTEQTIQRYVLRKEIPYLKMQILRELLLRSLCRILYSFIFYAVLTELENLAFCAVFTGWTDSGRRKDSHYFTDNFIYCFWYKQVERSGEAANRYGCCLGKLRCIPPNLIYPH
jgi:hypothetical protein